MTDIRVPKVRSTFVRWEVECERCGIVDSGISTKAAALEVERKHRQHHINSARQSPKEASS